MLYSTVYPSPIGRLTIICDEAHIKWLFTEGYRFLGRVPSVNESGTHSVLDLTCRWLDRYFASKKPDIKELPLAPDGGEFRQTVWKYLCEIPYGEVMTYGAIAAKTAKALGKDRMSAQAVGGAVGHNPISVIIPCHRVVGSDGNLTGYAGGIEKKIQLLRLEGVNMTRLFVRDERICTKIIESKNAGC